MLATDGVFCGPRQVVETGELGSWEATSVPDLFLVQPGLYYTGLDQKPKTRGVPQAAFAGIEGELRVEFQRMLDRAPGSGRVPVTLANFYGLRIAVARRKPGIAGTWDQAAVKDVSFSWVSKRSDAYLRDGHFRLAPIWQEIGIPNVPYSKDIGRTLERQRLLNYGELPEHAIPVTDLEP